MSALGDSKQKVPGLAFLLIPVVILLACCASQQRPDAQAKEAKVEAEAVAKETAAIDDARCQSFGFQPRSPRYAQCRKEFDSEREQMGITE